MRRKALIAAVSFLLALPTSAAEEDHPAAEFTRTMLEHMGAIIEACPQALRERYPERLVVCAAYPKSYSFFKLDWETNLQRHDLRTKVAASTPWTRRSGLYVREYEAGEIPVDVLFNDRTGRLAVAFVPPEPAEGESSGNAGLGFEDGVLDEPRLLVAGFGGVSLPEVIPESRIEPVMPERFRYAEKDGSVLLSVVVLEDGTVDEVTVLRVQPADRGLEQSAIEAVRQWRFEPAKLDGKPVDVQHTVRVRFPRPDPA